MTHKKSTRLFLLLCEHQDQPSVLLMKTVKGYGTVVGEGANIAHQLKKIDDETLSEDSRQIAHPLKRRGSQGIGVFSSW